MPKALLLGATSLAGKALALQLARADWELTLSGQNESELVLLQSDIRVRYHKDAAILIKDLANSQTNLNDIGKEIIQSDLVCIVFDEMEHIDFHDQKGIERTLRINFTIPVKLLTYVATHMEKAEKGSIVVYSSQLHQKIRDVYFPYSGAQSGLAAFIAGLQPRLQGQGIHLMHVITTNEDKTVQSNGYTITLPHLEIIAQKVIKGLKAKKKVIASTWLDRLVSAIVNR